MRRRIRRLRDGGLALRAIADRLSADGVPTAHRRGPWRASSVAVVLKTAR